MARSSSPKKTWRSGYPRVQNSISISANIGTTDGTALITSCFSRLILRKSTPGLRKPLKCPSRVPRKDLRAILLLGLGRGLGETLVNFFQVSLQAISNLLFERGEFNSHSHTRVTGPNYAVRSDLVRIDPEG